jgi:3-phosphoshikimate 1-carboxyvinyltransferase
MTDPLPIEPLARRPNTTVAVPGSKSITNRALICAALAPGVSVLEGALWADDTEAMVECLRSLGITIEVDGDQITVHGQGGAVPAASARLDVRLSGTTARFIPPVTARGCGRFEVDAAGPMRRRPMGPTFDALRSVDVRVEELGEPGCLPVVVTSPGVAGGHVTVSGDVSSQFVSGLLLAGFDVDLSTDLISKPYVEMTRAVMRSFEHPGRYAIEPDASAASYFFAAAAICGGRVTVEGLGSGSLQGDLVFVDVLEAMGATVERSTAATTVRVPGLNRETSDAPESATQILPKPAAIELGCEPTGMVATTRSLSGAMTDRVSLRELPTHTLP